MNILSTKDCAQYFVCVIPIKTNLKKLSAKYSYYVHIAREVGLGRGETTCLKGNKYIMFLNANSTEGKKPIMTPSSFF